MARARGVDRRTFIQAASAGGLWLAGCGRGSRETSPARHLTAGPRTAPDGPTLRAGLVGCGGRGTGAALNFLDAGPNLEIVALADLFQDRLDACRKQLKEKRHVDVAGDRCFVGFDAFRKLLDGDMDILIQATPPHFRPEHFAAAVRARKHVFLEKPLGVDPVGVRSILETAERAEALGLCVVTGTQFRHQTSFIETYNRVQEGAIGDIVAARGYSLRGQLWYRERRPEWSDMEAMLRDWVNWCWLSGDHIVEQHIHGLDVLFWFTGQYPTRAMGMGGRWQRVTGDQYDFFAVDFTDPQGIHVASRCRQMDGCTNEISRWVVGTHGSTNCENTIFTRDGEIAWKYEEPPGQPDNSPYVQEHIDLVTAIRTGPPVNEASSTARSTLAAIMARESAYSGLEVAWDELMESDQRLGPTEYAFGPVEMDRTVPAPGQAKTI